MTPPSGLTFPPDSAYRRLARALDGLPNSFPPAADESDLRLLAKIFLPEEAELAAGLLPELESPAQIAGRLGRDQREVTGLLKEMVKKGQIAAGKTAQGRFGFGLLPFVVGIYEAQAGHIDAELAQLFEVYYRQAFGQALKVQPQVHRVIPVGESIQNTMEVRPYESASGLVDRMQSWGVLDCICRKQKALVGDPCGHPLDVCMVLSENQDAFSGPAGGPLIRALTREEAHATLHRAAQAGLVHCVSNNQQETWYICNCCTCSCGVLRGMVELGIANVVAKSAFVNQVDEELCASCGECLSYCQFNALSLEAVAQVDAVRCTGCGVCVPACPQGALSLTRRPEASPPPLTEDEWRAARRAARSLH
jgi:Pyruvate/2-oxoacid:ferredoxin oxidoreductase delta subunit